MNTPPLPEWLAELQTQLKHGEPVVLVTLAHVEGSAPRAPGAKMVVGRRHTLQTIGGGHLEWRATEIARQMLRAGAEAPHATRRLERLTLDPGYGQSSTDIVTLAFERLTTITDLGWVATLAKRLETGQASVRSVGFGAGEPVMISTPEAGAAHADCLLWRVDGDTRSGASLLTEIIAPPNFHIVLFGAGHVGAALVRVLATLPCRLDWFDPRAEFKTVKIAGLAPAAPADLLTAVDAAPAGSYFVVVTHSHALDQDIAGRILRRADYAYLGVIGSRSKRRHLEHYFAAHGIDPMQLARMHCPIGLDSIDDQQPAALAIAVAAQLLSTQSRRNASGANRTHHA